MSDEKTGPVCILCKMPQKYHQHDMLYCSSSLQSAARFTPAEPEAKDVHSAAHGIDAQHRQRMRWATESELKAGELPLDSVGHVLEVGHAMTCMCCGSDGTVSLIPDNPDEGWNFQGSQWVRTPAWLLRLRTERDAAIERAEKAQREADACGETLKLCRENIDELCVSLAAVTAERDAKTMTVESLEHRVEELENYSHGLAVCIDDQPRLRDGLEAQLANATAERDRMRHVVEAAREFRSAAEIAEGAGYEERCRLFTELDALDGAQPTEPKRCTCVEHAEYGAMADCPVHGVERAGRSDNTSTAMMGDGIDVPGKAASTAAPERAFTSVAPAGKETGRLPAFAGFSGEAKRNPRAERPGYSSLSCLLCGVPVADLHTDSCGPGSFTTSGVIWRTAGNYGSAVFDSFDGLQLLAGMCDVCLTAKQGAILGAQKVAIEPHERWLYMAGEVAIRGDDIVPPGVPNDLNDWLGSTCGLLGIRGGDMDAVAAEIASWDAEPTPLPAERCHCGQHSMERPDIHSINWYWSKHTREACTLELPNVRCWCGRLRSEHIDGHAAPITPPAVDPRDVRIAELEQRNRDTWAAYCGADAQLNASQEWGRIIQDHRERVCARADALEADRDQQRARADDAEARCGEVAREQREACSDHIAQSSDSVARHFSRVVRGTPIVTDAKEKSK